LQARVRHVISVARWAIRPALRRTPCQAIAWCTRARETYTVLQDSVVRIMCVRERALCPRRLQGVFVFYRPIGRPRPTLQSLACKRSPTRTSSDSVARHATKASRPPLTPPSSSSTSDTMHANLGARQRHSTSTHSLTHLLGTELHEGCWSLRGSKIRVSKCTPPCLPAAQCRSSRVDKGSQQVVRYLSHNSCVILHNDQKGVVTDERQPSIHAQS
jgi:hypothetical protein